MRPFRTPFRTAAALAAALALTAGLALAPTTAARAEDEPGTDGPTYGAPEVGTCHDYGKKVYFAVSDTKPAVKCKEDHTAYTSAVVYLPDDMEWHQPTEEKYVAKFIRKVQPACDTANRKALDTDWRTFMKTAYTGAIFEPTDEQKEHGARWIRCDLILRTWAGRLQDLPARKPALKKITAAERSCLALRDGGAWLTSCDRKHHYKATHNHLFPRGKYPSDRKYYRYLNKYCTGTAQHPGYGRMGYQSAWIAGNRVLQCYEWDR
ncbi:septum formation family protein [Nocardioides sp. YIM 152588]|uniref:septum formation family protein n=1 Tax=Nocardioides sp. YIM 152588 TaxID=3158259 RepID=UPI0032E52EA0